MKKIPFLYSLFLVSFLIVSDKTKAQTSNQKFTEETVTEEPSLGLVAGYTGSGYNILEVGIGYQPWQVEGLFVEYPFAGFLALYEFDPSRKFYGTSLNAWYLSGLIAFGLNVNRYSDYKNETYGIKPMIGISSYRVGLMWGYNFFLNGNDIENLSNQSITIKYYHPLWKRKSDDISSKYSYR